jgi:hypothetical protein
MTGNGIYASIGGIIAFIGVALAVFINSLCSFGFTLAFTVCIAVLGFSGLTSVAGSRCLILFFIIFITFTCFLTLVHSFASSLAIPFYTTQSIYTLS